MRKSEGFKIARKKLRAKRRGYLDKESEESSESYASGAF